MSSENCNNNSEVFIMCNNGSCGGNMCWVIILLILFCGLGNNGGCGCGNNTRGGGCGCDNTCGCC